MAVDLGKQVGPLPLGAWVAVVGTGVGIAVYQRRTTASADPTIVDDTSGTPGVGVGGSGQWVNVDPPTGSDTGDVVPTTNEEWAVKAINYLIAHNYPPAMADSAIRKYIAGASDQLSTAEWALVTIALGALKSPPSPLPPSGTPPTGTPTTPATTTGYKFVQELHRITRAEGGRALVTRFSDGTVTTGSNIEQALRMTTGDVRNARFRTYFGAHGGSFPPGAIYVTTVKRK